MTLESQVISLSLAKRLNELGVNKQSWFFWVRLRDRNAQDEWELVFAGDKRLTKTDMYEWLAAYTVAELGEICKDLLLVTYERGAWWWQEPSYRASDFSETQAEAYGNGLAYLITNDFITL